MSHCSRKLRQSWSVVWCPHWEIVRVSNFLSSQNQTVSQRWEHYQPFIAIKVINTASSRACTGQQDQELQIIPKQKTRNWNNYYNNNKSLQGWYCLLLQLKWIFTMYLPNCSVQKYKSIGLSLSIRKTFMKNISEMMIQRLRGLVLEGTQHWN